MLISDVASRILAKDVGIFPFDTVWGLTGLVEPGIQRRLNRIKQRDETQPILAVIPDDSWVEKLVGTPTALQREWMAKSWPGPVTLVFGEWALRWPDFAPLNELLSSVGKPLYSTSANVSGEPFPARFGDISGEILSQVDFTYRHCEPGLGRESHIVDLRGREAKRLR